MKSVKNIFKIGIGLQNLHGGGEVVVLEHPGIFALGGVAVQIFKDGLGPGGQQIQFFANGGVRDPELKAGDQNRLVILAGFRFCQSFRFCGGRGRFFGLFQIGTGIGPAEAGLCRGAGLCGTQAK